MPFDYHSPHVVEGKLAAVIRHWLPIVTFCPVNKLPDLLYVSMVFSEPVPELYTVRKLIRKHLMWKCIFMEDAAKLLAELYPAADQVEIRLAFNRHHVIWTR